MRFSKELGADGVPVDFDGCRHDWEEHQKTGSSGRGRPLEVKLGVEEGEPTYVVGKKTWADMLVELSQAREREGELESALATVKEKAAADAKDCETALGISREMREALEKTGRVMKARLEELEGDHDSAVRAMRQARGERDECVARAEEILKEQRRLSDGWVAETKNQVATTQLLVGADREARRQKNAAAYLVGAIGALLID